MWAGSGKADNNSDFSAIMCYALGIKCKIIVGYKGTGDMNLAIQRGEVDGRVISDESAALYGPSSSGMRVVTTLARKRSEKVPRRADRVRSGHYRRGAGAPARLARQHRRPRPRDPRSRPARRRSASNSCAQALGDILRDPAFVAEVKKVNLAAGYASAEEVQAIGRAGDDTLDDNGLAEMNDIALDRYYH